MSQEKKNDGFIMQAGILAITGILVRVIGILYRAPLTGIIVHTIYIRSFC